MYTCAGLIIYKSNFILVNISYQNEHLECGQNGAATAIPTALQRAGVIPTVSRSCRNCLETNICQFFYLGQVSPEIWACEKMKK